MDMPNIMSISCRLPLKIVLHFRLRADSATFFHVSQSTLEVIFIDVSLVALFGVVGGNQTHLTPWQVLVATVNILHRWWG